MQIVIGGDDALALELAEELMRDHTVVLICPRELGGPAVEALDAKVVFGEVASNEAQTRAGVTSADVFIACTRHDEQNLVACVAARRLGAQQTVCFLFRLDASEAGSSARGPLGEALAIDVIVRPAEQLAEEIVRIVTVPGALDVEAFAGGKVRLLRHTVEEGSLLTRAPLREIHVPEGVVLVMARRGDEVFIPRGETRLQAGDKVTAMGLPRDLDRLLFRFLRSVDHAPDARTATVVGGGGVGLGVAQGLVESGWRVKIVEFDRERCEQIAPLVDALVLQGDGSDIDLLEEERVADDAVLVAVTSNDEKNLLVSLVAKHLGVPRVVTRADNEGNDRLFEKVGIDVVRSQRGAAVQSVIRRLERGGAELLAELEHGEAVVLELRVPDEVAPTPLAQIRQPVFAIIGAILRGKRVVIPRGADVIQGGDRILVFCSRKDEDTIREFFARKLHRGTPAA